jgi:hypothetical protein
MLPRERVINALEFKPVDKPALDCDISGVGLYEHGEKIRELFKSIGSDFNPISEAPIPQPPTDAVDQQGRYLEYRTDEWGVEWVYRIFGIQGHPSRRPLDDWANLKEYRLPPVAPARDNREEFDWICRDLAEQRKTYFRRTGWVSLFEKMESLRRFEDILMDLYDDVPEIHELADRITRRSQQEIDNFLAYGFDAVQFGDDFGTQRGMMISPEIFRSFFKPRYAELMKPIKAAGKKVLFHSCGYIWPILEDLKEIGVDGIWPQLNAYDLKELAARCRDLGLAVAIHPERSNLMTKGTPDEVRRTMYQYAEIFRPCDGGSWFYLEIDNGFPYENIEAMVRVVRELRE